MVWGGFGEKTQGERQERKVRERKGWTDRDTSEQGRERERERERDGSKNKRRGGEDEY